jgi:hypothetical protein
LCRHIENSNAGLAVIAKEQTQALAEAGQPVLGQVGQLDVEHSLGQIS